MGGMTDLNALNLEAGSLVGGYTLISRLGGGAMGSVWRVKDDGGTVYAMKILRDSLVDDEPADEDDTARTPADGFRTGETSKATARERLRREAAALRRVNHPGVCQIVDMELDDSLAFIVTELIEGKNLREDVAANGRYVAGDLERLARKLIDAVSAVHRAGIIHRDIKPTNVMISRTGPVLVDFGIAMGEGESHVTRTGLVMGTPGFIAPEIIDGVESSETTDWWSVAAVLAFAATGRPVFGTKPMMAVLERAAAGHANLAGLPPRTTAAFRRALSPNRDERCTPLELLQTIERDALTPELWSFSASAALSGIGETEAGTAATGADAATDTANGTPVSTPASDSTAVPGPADSVYTPSFINTALGDGGDVVSPISSGGFPAIGGSLTGQTVPATDSGTDRTDGSTDGETGNGKGAVRPFGENSADPDNPRTLWKEQDERADAPTQLVKTPVVTPDALQATQVIPHDRAAAAALANAAATMPLKARSFDPRAHANDLSTMTLHTAASEKTDGRNDDGESWIGSNGLPNDGMPLGTQIVTKASIPAPAKPAAEAGIAAAPAIRPLSATVPISRVPLPPRAASRSATVPIPTASIAAVQSPSMPTPAVPSAAAPAPTRPRMAQSSAVTATQPADPEATTVMAPLEDMAPLEEPRDRAEPAYPASTYAEPPADINPEPYAVPYDHEDAMVSWYMPRGRSLLMLLTIPLCLFAATAPFGGAIAAAFLLWAFTVLGLSTRSQLKREAKRGGERKSTDSAWIIGALPWHLVKGLALAIGPVLLMVVILLTLSSFLTVALNLISADFVISIARFDIRIPVAADVPLSASGLMLFLSMAASWSVAALGPYSRTARLGAGAVRGTYGSPKPPWQLSDPSDDRQDENGFTVSEEDVQSARRRNWTLTIIWAVLILTGIALILANNSIDWSPLVLS